MKEIIRGREEPEWCGPATLAFSAREQGLPYPSQKDLAEKIYDPSWGTDGDAMIVGCRLLGLSGEWVQKELDELNTLRKQGASVIVSYMSGQNETEDGHYSVLSAVTEKIEALQDPEWTGKITIFRREDFEKIWFDMDEDGNRQERWALVITKPYIILPTSGK